MIRVISVLLVSLAIPDAFANDDCEGCKDYRGTSRMPGYYIRSLDEAKFDTYAFTVTEGRAEKKQAVEGRLYKYRYQLNEGASVASAMQIVRNYQNAARAVGGQVLWESGDGSWRATTVRFRKDANEIWMEVDANSGADQLYFINIIEKQTMQQDVAIDAKAMAGSLAETGHVEVSGILFDFGQSQVKKESDPALQEIAKLLRAHPTMKVWVVGHTDAVGSPDTNLKLSSARAAAVIDVLTQKLGIDARRLASFGAGPYAPVAPNKTDEGRARNRRVELVEHF